MNYCYKVIISLLTETVCPTWATSNHFELNGLDRPLKLPQNSSIFWANTIKNEKTKEAEEDVQGAKMMMKKFSALCRPSPLHPEDSSLEQCCSRQVCNFLLQVFDRWWLDRVTFFYVSTWVLLSIMEPPWFNRLVYQLVIFLIFKPTWSSYTVWKFQNFAITRILREFNFEDSCNAKSAILTHLEAPNFDFNEFLQFVKAAIHQISKMC